MEFIIELILDLFIDSVEGILPNSKIPKKLRVVLGIIACAIISAIILGVIVLGALIIKDSVLGGIIMIAIGLAMLVGFICKVIKTKNKCGL